MISYECTMSGKPFLKLGSRFMLLWTRGHCLDVAEVDIEVGGQLPRPLALDLPQVVNEAQLRGRKPLAFLVLRLLARGVGNQALAPEFVVAANLVIVHLGEAFKKKKLTIVNLGERGGLKIFEMSTF